MDYGARIIFFRKQSGVSKVNDGKEQGHNDGTPEVNAILDWFGQLDGGEAICWGFDTVPSRVDKIIWSYTDDDISCRLKIKLGEKKALTTEILQGFSYVVSCALGGAPESKPVKTKKTLENPSQFENMFGKDAVGGRIDDSGKDVFDGLDDLFAKMEQDNG